MSVSVMTGPVTSAPLNTSFISCAQYSSNKKYPRSPLPPNMGLACLKYDMPHGLKRAL